MIVDEIENQLQQRNQKEISSSDLGEMILLHLKGMNEVAYIRFASVYRQFNGINDFIDTLESFKPSEKFATIV